MLPRRTGTLATLLALALSAALAGPALAVPVPIPGAPLTVYVDELGQLQAKRDNGPNNIFYNPASTTGDAGLFLAFPAPSGDATLNGAVYGFSPDASAGAVFKDYEALTQGQPTGDGSPGNPLKQVTTYAVRPADTNLLEVTQTTTYVNGAQQFGVRWDVKNTTAGALTLKALAAADVWPKVAAAGAGAGPTFNNDVVGSRSTTPAGSSGTTSRSRPARRGPSS
jgi:hypothetical protein